MAKDKHLTQDYRAACENFAKAEEAENYEEMRRLANMLRDQSQFHELGHAAKKKIRTEFGINGQTLADASEYVSPEEDISERLYSAKALRDH